MSRTGRPVGRIMQRFPCVSGDDPFLYDSFDRYLGFSLRKRG